MNPDALRFTDHAIERCHEMGMRTKDVRRALREDLSHSAPDSRPGLRPDRERSTVHFTSELAIVEGEHGRIVTVWWRYTGSREERLSDECRTDGVRSTE